MNVTREKKDIFYLYVINHEGNVTDICNFKRVTNDRRMCFLQSFGPLRHSIGNSKPIIMLSFSGQIKKGANFCFRYNALS